jgi:hypothetical protein
MTSVASTNIIKNNIEKNEIQTRKTLNFTSKETYYYKMITNFFKEIENNKVQKMLNIINGKSKISLRLLDWFVTRYAKKHKTGYNTENEEDNFSSDSITTIDDTDINLNKYFAVHISYKAQLKSYKKKYFDPFRRRKKFYYKYDKNDSTKFLYTTIGQLNFFRWAFSNNIIEYVEENYDEINKAMIKSNKEDKERKQDSTKSKKSVEKTTIEKHGVNVEAEKEIKNDQVKITVSFF